MKKVLLMFAFIATLLVGSIGTAGAQVPYTVFDGTTPNSYIPLWGLYCDEYFKCEYVIPADHLDAINGSTISKLTYYLGTSAEASWGNANFQVFVKEVASSSIANFSGTDDATIVYQGSLDGTGSTMEIDFATPYTYNGGNLLIGIYNTVKGTYKSAYFLGQTITGSSIYGHNSSRLDDVTSPTAANFIPKTTFTVNELHGCLTPTDLAVSDITTYGATVTWTPGNTETAWVVKFNNNEYPVSGTPSYTVTGLTPETDYVASVKAVCGDTEESEYTTPGVLFTTLPTCPKPTGVTVSNITPHTADIAWTEQGTANEWIIMLDTIEIPADSNPFLLTGLDAATSYTVKVKAVCSEGDESNWSATASFTTECETVVVTANNPFAEDFNTLTSGIPICWDNAEGTVTNASYRWNYYATGVTGHCVRFNSYFPSSGQYSLLKTPVLDLTAINNPMITFTHKNPAAAQGFEVMYTTDGSTYTPIATGLQGAADWTTEEIVVPALANATNVMFIFKGISNCGSNSSNSHIFLDDVMVGEAPTCPKPTEVTVSNITAHTANIAWTENGTANEWVVMLDTIEIPADSNPFPLTGLDAATSYTVKVKAVCSEEEESNWSATASFTTECDVVVVTATNPFVEDFNTLTSGIPICWDNAEGTVTTASYRWNYYATGVTGHCVRFNSYFPSSGQYSLLKTPVLDLTAINNPMITFTHKNPAAAQGFEVMYTTDGSTYTPIATGLQGAADWTTEEIAVPALANATNVMFIFKGISNCGSNSSNSHIFLDDVMVGEAPTCPKPKDVVVSNITTTGAYIAWTNGGTENAWTIDINGNEYPAPTNPFTVTGLMPSSNYTVSVKANCAADDESVLSIPTTFSTLCGAITIDEANPYVEDFSFYGFATSQSNSTRYMPTCWDQIFSGTSQSYAGTVYKGTYSNNHVCYAIVAGSAATYGYENYAILPEFANDYTTLQIAFGTTMEDGYGTLELGYVTDITDTTTFVVLDTIPSNSQSSIVNHLIYLNGYTFAQGARLAFRYGDLASSYRTCGIHDLSVSLLPSCFIPNNVAIVDSLTTDNSAVVDWTPYGDENQWEVACNGDTTLVSAHPFTITGLEAATVYSVSVRAYCSAGDQSEWSTEVPFYTECAEVVVVTAENPYHEGWEEDVICWGRAQLAGSANWQLYDEDPYEGTYSIIFPYTEGAQGLLVSPVFDLTQVANPELSFAYWTNNWEGTCDQMYVYYTTEEDTTWNLIASFTTPMEDYDVATYLLPNPTSAYQIAFKGIGMDGNLVFLDDINITGEAIVEPCATPANVTVENNVATWESEAENFNLMYVVANDTFPVEVAGNTYTFEGLEDSTVVTVMVQAICGEDNTSDWSEAAEFVFTTPEDTIGIRNYTLNANVYPNPAHDVVNVECSAIGADLSVYDMFGKVVMNTTIQSERTELNLSNVAPGVYMIRIANNNAITTVKVVKR